MASKSTISSLPKGYQL